MEALDTGAGWRPDPTGRHELRFWTGVRWADHVCDAGVVSLDSGMAEPAPVAVARAPGWYPDPLGIRDTRYFDGKQWAETAVIEAEPGARSSRRRVLLAIVAVTALVIAGGV